MACKMEQGQNSRKPSWSGGNRTDGMPDGLPWLLHMKRDEMKMTWQKTNQRRKFRAVVNKNSCLKRRMITANLQRHLRIKTFHPLMSSVKMTQESEVSNQHQN